MSCNIALTSRVLTENKNEFQEEKSNRYTLRALFLQTLRANFTLVIPV